MNLLAPPSSRKQTYDDRFEMERRGKGFYAVEFYKVLGQFKGTIDAQDSLVWQDHNRDNFSVRRAYKKFNPCNSQGNGWPWKLILKTKIPYKVSCFTWLLAKQEFFDPGKSNEKKYSTES